MYIGLQVKYRLFLSDFNETCIFSKDFLKIISYEISRKSVWWGPGFSMRTNGQTDRTKLIVAFRNFAYTPKNGMIHNHNYLHTERCKCRGKRNKYIQARM